MKKWNMALMIGIALHAGMSHSGMVVK